MKEINLITDIAKQKKLDMPQQKAKIELFKILNQFPNPIWRAGIDAKCNFFNTGWLEFTGRTFEEEIGDGWTQGVHPDDIAGCFDTYMNAFIYQKSFEMEYRLLHHSGEYRYILDCGRPIYDEDGTFDGYIGSCYDIHDAKILREKLSSLTEEYETIFNGTQDSMFLIDVDCNGNTVYRKNNRAHEILIGRKCNEIKGRTPREVLGDEVGSLLESYYNQCITKKSAISYEQTLDLGTGERIWHTVLTPIIKEGHVAQIVGSRRDLTKLIKMEKALIDSEERYRNFFENNHAVMLIVEPETGNLVIANKAASKFYGYSIQELIQMRISDINALTNEQIQKEMKTANIEKRNHFFFKHKLANGEIRDVEVYSGPMIISGKQLLYSIIHDITDRRKAENELSTEKKLIEYLGLYDNLTGLYNRAFLEKELERVELDAIIPVSLIMGDVNGLKLTNDAFGHEIGDKLLKKIANILKSECREKGMIARAGGDEFVILLPKVGIDETEKIIERIIDKCAEEKGDPIKPSISLGFSVKEHKSQQINNIYKAAEDMMYSTKLMEGKSIRSSIISSLRKTLSERTHETDEHCARLKGLSLKFGKALRLSIDMIHNLQLLAMLHDIGISAIPDYILNKKGDLTLEDWEVMEKHCEIGYRIACASPDLAHIANDILHHHENWDGSGYPRGIAGKDIPLSSRVISVLDCYDSLVYGSFYQKPVSKQEAIEFIKNQSGIRFDPEVVSVFKKIIN